MCLWRHAVEFRIVDQPPIRVRRLRMPARRPECWTPREVSELIAAAWKIRGRFRGTTIRRGPNLASLLMAGWDTGYRLGDLTRLSAENIRSDGRVDRSQLAEPVEAPDLDRLTG